MRTYKAYGEQNQCR